MDSDSENRAIESVTLDNEQETEKMIRVLQALNITLVDGHLPMSVKNTVNFILLKEQAEEVRRILIQDLEADRIVETYTIRHVISTIEKELLKIEERRNISNQRESK
jgi:hypothetical protein